ncbi:MAG TPA: TonB-dependent receptor [Gemmatimonadales bacterium]|nr:TonB-dependent receptor [Gemmatimonadales bacterium]
MDPMRLCRRLLPVLGLLVGVDAARATQAQNTAILSGRVVASTTGEPLLGVQVIVTGTRYWALSNTDGQFRITGLPPGRHVVEVKHAERAPLAFPLLFEPGKTVELAVRLETGSVPLPELLVEGRSEPAGKMTAFFQRKSSGQGYFVTRDEIEKRAPRVMTDMLRMVPGLRISCDFGKCTAQSFQESRRIMGGCPIQYFLDGLPFLGDVDEMTPDQVEGIEIYRGSASVPPEFNRGTALCGVIAIWSRVPG